MRSLQSEVLEAQKALASLHADKQLSEAALQVSQVLASRARSCNLPLLTTLVSSSTLYFHAHIFPCRQRDHDNERRARVRLMEVMTELEDGARETEQQLLSSQSDVASLKLQLQVKQTAVVLRSTKLLTCCVALVRCLAELLAGSGCWETGHARADRRQRCAVEKGDGGFELGAGEAARQR